MATLIGIDCATQPRKVGLALGSTTNGGVEIEECRTGSATESPRTIIQQWISSAHTVVIALDAPLGWAAPLGQALNRHSAGSPIDYSADVLFKRATDVSIRSRFEKSPLEVGANLISRTAVAALLLLRELSEDTRQSIQLAWDSENLAPISAIEVYPAVTRLARGALDKGGSLEGLSPWIEFRPSVDVRMLSPDAIDAAVCVLAAADFIDGRSPGPDDRELARLEGWIWAPDRKDCLASGRYV